MSAATALLRRARPYLHSAAGALTMTAAVLAAHRSEVAAVLTGMSALLWVNWHLCRLGAVVQRGESHGAWRWHPVGRSRLRYAVLGAFVVVATVIRIWIADWKSLGPVGLVALGGTAWATAFAASRWLRISTSARPKTPAALPSL